MDDAASREPTPTSTLATVGNAMVSLTETVSRLALRVERLEAIERRLNYPVVALLGGILVTLIYIAHRLP